MKEGRRPNHLMMWAPGDWLSSGVRTRLIIRGDHLARLAYREILDRLWMDAGQVHRRDLDGVIGCSHEEAERCLSVLVEVGGLTVDDDGFVHNTRITNDLQKVEEANKNRTGRPKRVKVAEVHRSPLKSTEVVGTETETETGTGTETETESSRSSEALTVPKGQLTLVPPTAIPPRTSEHRVEETAIAFLAARQMRLHGWEPGKPVREPSKGMVKAVAERVKVLLREGYDAALLVSLPVLVADDALDFMLRKDPLVLLRTDNAQGGKCHARRYEAQLEGAFLNPRQVAILRNLGTIEYVKGRGARAASWEV